MDFFTFVKGLPLVGKSQQKRVLFYSVDSLYDKPFIYFTGIQTGNTIDAFPIFETKEDITVKGMVFKGVYHFKGVDYHVNEIPVVYHLEKPSKQCKITPYEILCIRHVEGVPIDPSSILFLKSHSYLSILRDENGKDIKIPGSFYLSLPKSCVKEQLFIPSISDGIFKKGYYLYTHERCLETAREHLFTLPNTLHLDSAKGTVTQRNGKLYLNKHELGSTREKIGPHTTITVEQVTPQWIMLKTNKPHEIEEEWCILRYLCNLEHHWIGQRAKKEYDSFSYDQTFKYINPDGVKCISMSTWTK